MKPEVYRLQKILGLSRAVSLSGLAFVLFISLSTLSAPIAGAQADIVQIGNDWVAAYVNTSQKAGRFWISAGPKKNWFQFLFHGNKSPQQITSNIVFRVDRGDGNPQFYTNNPKDFFSGRPIFGNDTIDFLPFKAIRVRRDTIEIDYDLKIYDVTVRLVAEPTATRFDNGADVLIEFEYHVKPFVGGGTIGVMLMLDGDNGAAVGSVGGSGDNTSVMTTDGYFDVNKSGYVFPQPERPMPDFYHVGNFLYLQNPAENKQNKILPIHRLIGVSNGGANLHQPDLFGVGNWDIYKKTAWNPGPHNRVGDVATALQWNRLAGHGLVRTAFGTNNESRNNIYTCRDRQVFADVRTVREIRQTSNNGPYEIEEFEVEMWVTNTGDYELFNSVIRLDRPVETFPNGTERLVLDPSTSQDQEALLLPGFTRKLVWKLRLNPNSNDTLAKINFLMRDRDGTFRPFLDECAPYVTISPFSPPPTDTIPPVIERLGSGRDWTSFWNFSIYDRHPGFDYDTGIDSIWIRQNQGNNFRMILNPFPFVKCDIAETVKIRFEVVDTTREAYVLFNVRDCKGNVGVDSIRYSPRPDPFTPNIIRRDSTGSWNEAVFPCNARIRVVDVYDNDIQSPLRGNYGLGSIQGINLSNFQPLVITNQRGVVGGAIFDFDSTASFSLEVLDTLSNAVAEVRVSDYAGNDTILHFFYCTIDDFQPPKIRRTGNSATKWDFSVTDSAEWDRGLLEVEAIEASNVRYIWPDGTRRDSLPGFNKGSRAVTLGVELVDRCLPARLILEYRDLQYQVNAEAHISRDTITYAGIPDTLAPNIAIDPGFDLTTYFFDVEIDDIHYPGGNLFECDKGIETISISTTGNIRVRTPLVSIDEFLTTVAFEVIDTLAIDRTDTICITAVDSAGNTTSRCTFWPSTPDRNSPIFNGVFDRSQGAIIGEARDDRENDRGLSSLTIRDEENINPASGVSGLIGQGRTAINITVPFPENPISGELVLQDLYGEIVRSPESSIHTVIIPFDLPVVSLSIEMPELIEAWTEFEVPIRTEGSIDAAMIRSIAMEFEQIGPGKFLYWQGSPTVRGSFTVTEGTGDRLIIRYEPAAGERIPEKTLLGTLRFEAASTSTQIVPFRLRPVPGTMITNDGADTTITIYGRPDDTVASTLRLPSPLMKLASDSVTWINGDCNRVLATSGAAKPSGLAILAIEPNVVFSDRPEIQIVIRDLPAEGGEIEWIAPDGRVISRSILYSDGFEVDRYTIPVPTGGASGTYLIRIRAGEDSEGAQVLLVY